jgi:hypothetical protein
MQYISFKNSFLRFPVNFLLSIHEEKENYKRCLREITVKAKCSAVQQGRQEWRNRLEIENECYTKHNKKIPQHRIE